jgi:hypothetical protein
MVQTNTVEAPGAGDAGVIRIKNSNAGAPQRGLAMALDGNGRWCYLDPRLGAMHAVAEAARKVACSGATPVGATNCLNFGNPEKPHIMWQFSQTIDGITKACEELGDSPSPAATSVLQRDAGRRYLSHAGAWSGGDSRRRAAKLRRCISPRPDARSCYCARAKQPISPMWRVSLDRRNTRKKFWARCGDILRNSIWRKKRRCRKQ